MRRAASSFALALCAGLTVATLGQSAETIDFNRDIRPILANNCFKCHGPDPRERKADLRLDTEDGARADLGGYAAVVPGKPAQSVLVERITSTKAGAMMPPRKSGKKLTPHEIELLTGWIRQGAPYARHWAYTQPVRAVLPAVKDPSWPRNAIDTFLLARLEKEGLRPAPEADRHALIRRVSLDLTGLPPTLEEVEQFVKDPNPDAYERLVDRLLKKPAFGEHWARLWLDLARYADSAGYADDPIRTIWAYRDYVIRSFNANKPFNQFTIEQLAGDLLPNPSDEQLVATAFHRNTMTNNEGGTNDEEFRNVAIVDRVNTTLAVWMGTSMACAQCHTHKYDPITQEEYFRFFAFLNNTQDADRGDESPLLTVFSEEQKRQKRQWQEEIAALEKTLRTPTPALGASQLRWEKEVPLDVPWQTLRPAPISTAVRALRGDKAGGQKLTFSLDGRLIAALLVEAVLGPQSGGLGQVRATLTPPGSSRPLGRFVRVELPGRQKFLSLAEVQVYAGKDNLARKGTATQSSTAFDGPPRLAIDGNTDGDYTRAKSTTHTAISDNPWWEVDLGGARPLDRIVVWNRTDGGLHTRLDGFRVVVLDDKRRAVWEQSVPKAPASSIELHPDGAQLIPFANRVSTPAVKPAPGKAQTLLLVPTQPVEVHPGSVLTLTFEQPVREVIRVAVSSDRRAADYARTPENIRTLLKLPVEKRSPAQTAALTDHYLAIAPELQPSRDRLAGLRKQLAELKPATTVPILRDLSGAGRRKTRIQRRGNYLDLGPEVSEGIPAAFHPLPNGASLNRLTLARWLVDDNNPLTARVLANRLWEQIFGTGIVRTTEEFGTQGELPSHPELLDWLATEMVRQNWNVKDFLRMLVLSAAYRQSSRVTPELLERDPDNRLLARGPRFRLSAEVLRDQALFVSGLLSARMYGPPVRPPQPLSGLAAAFGSGIDWQTSPGEDRHRRGLYTEWRRSNPYPSMLTFDAPNREVCTLRRTRTNTPLQALVTLNDPVYVEAAQALARRIVAVAGSPADKLRTGFRMCVARPPSMAEMGRLLKLYEQAHADFTRSADNARHIATEPLGPPPTGTDMAELASWTVVANVLLNLDEMFMKR